MRDEIIGEIRRLAAVNSGRPPGQKLFVKETGIAEHQWRGRYWSKWSDAVAEAGFLPNVWNERGDSDEVLSGFIAACRHYRHFPTNAELEILRRADTSVPHPNVLRGHFGGRAGLLAALRQRIAEDPSYADIAALLPTSAQPKPSAPSKAVVEGFVYLIKSGQFYKVGRSDDIERRIKEIRIALPDKATLVHTIRTDDPAGIEAYWHRRFADRRANGEWFKLSSQDIAAFRKRRFQ